MYEPTGHRRWMPLQNATMRSRVPSSTAVIMLLVRGSPGPCAHELGEVSLVKVDQTR